MNETQQKIDGAYMTPSSIVKKMIEFTPQEWFKENILEPTAGDGNIVLAILDKKVELGMTPFEAMNTTYANELDHERYLTMLHRVKEWCEEHDVMTDVEHFTNMDARELKWTVDYKVLTNLPFGCWSCSTLPKQIITHLNKPGVYLTKWSTGCNTKFCKSVIKFENIEFPGIVYDCLLWQYDPNVKFEKPQVWIYYPIPMFPKHKLKKEVSRKGDVLNKLETNGSRTLRKRLKETQNTSCGIWKDQNINHYKDYEDLNCQIYGKWLDAIDTSAIRHLRIPRDILDDFYYEHKEKYETRL